jgi:V8-like Glu-specific endopeptidase
LSPLSVIGRPIRRHQPRGVRSVSVAVAVVQGARLPAGSHAALAGPGNKPLLPREGIESSNSPEEARAVFEKWSSLLVDDVGQHAFAGASRPSAIVGADNRYRVSPTTAFSANSIGVLRWKDHAGANRICTGFIYGVNVVITAAHCVYGSEGGGPRRWYNTTGGYTFERARNDSYKPQTCNSTALYTNSAWIGGDEGAWNDFAAVKFSCTFQGTYGTGIQAIVARPCYINDSPYVWINGYPGDHLNQQWEAYEPLYDGGCTGFVHNGDHTGGQSGGPIIKACTEYGWSECSIGSIKGSLSFLWNTFNVDHRWDPGRDIAILIQWRGY